MTVFGYCRCSTNESKQDIYRQVRELKEAGAEIICTEYTHGDTAYKKELQNLLDKAAEGDVILTLEISRLARSTKQLCDIIDIVKEKKLCLRVKGSITVDCTSGTLDPASEAFCKIAAVFAELELQLIRARVKSGMQNAKEKGSAIGRPKTTKEDIPTLFYKHYPAYKAGRINKAEYARICNVSRKSIYKYLKLVGEES